MLELHVWGPAFGLPSFDPQCLAAVTYLQLTLPPGSWTLVPSSNPRLSPGKTLPALRDNTVWTSSLASIVAYLRQRHPATSMLGGRDPPAPLETAFCTYISQHGRDLFDLAFFAAGTNYTAVTRPLFSRLLRFPVQYYLPMSLRSAARTRVETLGVDALDGDFQDAEPAGDELTAAEREARASSITPLQSWLRKSPDVVAGIKLRELVDEFLDTLEKQLGAHEFMLRGREPTLVDVWAVAYLSIFSKACLPFSFLKDGMNRHRQLVEYTDSLRDEFLGPSVDIETVERGEAQELPWGKVEKGDLPWLTGFLVDQLKESLVLPKLGPEVPDDEKVEEDDDPVVAARKQRMATIRRREWWKSVAAVGLGVFGFVGYVFWSGMLSLQIGGAEVEEDEIEVNLEIDADDEEVEDIDEDEE